MFHISLTINATVVGDHTTVEADDFDELLEAQTTTQCANCRCLIPILSDRNLCDDCEWELEVDDVPVDLEAHFDFWLEQAKTYPYGSSARKSCLAIATQYE